MKSLLQLVLTLTVFIPFTQSQIITTIAGNGTAGYSGDGGLATAALLDTPNHLAYDQAGNLYIAEDYNFIVRKIDVSGNISTVAGTGTQGFSGDGGLAINAELDRVTGVAVDNAGNIYISDTDNFRIRKVDALGNISTIVGTGNEGYSGDGGLATSAEIGFVSGICVDGSGNLYLANQTYHNIRKVNAAGIITTYAGDGSGNPGYGGEGVVAATTMVNSPASVFMDAAGNLFFSELGGFRIRKINTSGIVTTVAGTGSLGSSGDGGAATSAQIFYPYGLVVSSTGVILFCESANNKIRKIDASGNISTFAGVGGLFTGYSGDNGPALLAQFANPSAIILDNNNNVIIGDYANNAIRKITTGPASLTDLSSDFNMDISPNPFSDKTTLSFGEVQENVTINVVNEIGVTVRSSQFTGNEYIIEKNELVKGMYFIRVVNNNEVVTNKKVIIQ